MKALLVITFKSLPIQKFFDKGERNLNFLFAIRTAEDTAGVKVEANSV